MSTTRVTRHIRASRSAVYRALLDRDSVQHWMVPDGMTSRVHVFEPYQDGTFRISLTYDAPTDAGKTDANRAPNEVGTNFPDRLAHVGVDARIRFALHGNRPRFAARLMPHQRVHELWIHRECARRHQCYEVHRFRSVKIPPAAKRRVDAIVLGAVKGKARAPACGRP